MNFTLIGPVLSGKTASVIASRWKERYSKFQENVYKLEEILLEYVDILERDNNKKFPYDKLYFAKNFLSIISRKFEMDILDYYSKKFESLNKRDIENLLDIFEENILPFVSSTKGINKYLIPIEDITGRIIKEIPIYEIPGQTIEDFAKNSLPEKDKEVIMKILRSGKLVIFLPPFIVLPLEYKRVGIEVNIDEVSDNLFYLSEDFIYLTKLLRNGNKKRAIIFLSLFDEKPKGLINLLKGYSKDVSKLNSKGRISKFVEMNSYRIMDGLEKLLPNIDQKALYNLSLRISYLIERLGIRQYYIEVASSEEIEKFLFVNKLIKYV